MSNPTEQLLMTLGSHWALLNIVVVSMTVLFMCKKKKPTAAAVTGVTTGTTAPSAPAGDKKPEENKEKKKEEKPKEKEEKKSEKKEGSKKSKKEKSKKEESKKGEKKEDEGGEKKEKDGDEKKEEGGEEKKETSKKETGSKKAGGSKKGTPKKKDGSKLVDIDEHASDLKEKTDKSSPADGGEKKEDDGGEKKEEKKEEEHKLLIDPKELKFTNPDGKAEILKLNLNNTTGLRIGVKIKCSDNTLFRVNPVFSFLEKDAKCVVEISRNAGNSKQDKLSVAYVEAPPDLEDAQAVFKVVQTVAASKIKTINVDLNAEAAK